MKVGALKETFDKEARVAMTPESAVQIQKLGYACFIEKGAGIAAGFSDKTYQDAGVGIVESAKALCQKVDIVIKLRPPSESEFKLFKKDQTLIGFFNPGGAPDALKRASAQGVNVIAMEMVPRISRAQKMDALSSMANIGGYRAVIEAGNHFGRFFTGQVTAAGKVPPAKVLVIGAGVAGLAAIGTAQSLGAVVRAFDVRPEVAEQIESMGAEFLLLDFDDNQDGAATGGYAAPSSPEFRDKQLALFLEQAPEIDIVITTALIPNQPAPELWTAEMVSAMKTGSVIIDLAAEQGGNCKLTVKDKKITTPNGVIIIGYTDFPSRMAAQASTLYATNIRHMLSDLTPKQDGGLVHDMHDDVIRGATVVFGGEITYPPPPPKVQAIASKVVPKAPIKTPEEIAADEAAILAKSGRQQTGLLLVGAVMMAVIGIYAPPDFMRHFIVFVLAVFVGFQVIWGVAHALHTPLMSVTNAISGIIIVGALLQINSGNQIATILAAISVLIATINIVGGFMVTRRMLRMFRKS